ncbi:MAG TPA: hypothetical protein ENJ22_01020 [Gammaproteobacteria bacterium]|nr:hypothetical protein [Gammaproteobacteria bacterium]
MSRENRFDKTGTPLVIQDPRLPATGYQEEELSLVDLWLMLGGHRRLMSGVFLACVVLGIVLALTLPRTHEFSTTIEIARNGDGLLESPQSVLAKLRKSYIPGVLGNASLPESLEVDASIPRKSEVVVLVSRAPLAWEDEVRQLHEKIVQRLAADHERRLGITRKELQVQLDGAKRRLQDLRQQERRLLAREKRLDEKEKRLQRQLAEAKSQLTQAQKERRQLLSAQTTGGSQPMGLILMDSEIAQFRQHRARLEEMLDLELPEERNRLESERQSLRSRQAEQQDRIGVLEAKISGLAGTRAVAPAMPSVEPVGLGGMAVLALALVLGGMLALLAAFGAEFMARVKARQAAS